MHFYPYRFDEVLKEKAVIVFSLLDEMYCIHAFDVLEQVNIISVPHMKDSQSFIQPYLDMTKDMVEELRGEDYTEIETLKGVLNG